MKRAKSIKKLPPGHLVWWQQVREKQREEGAWVAAGETEKRIEALEADTGAARAAETIFCKIEQVAKAVGPGHVNVGRLQVASAVVFS